MLRKWLSFSIFITLVSVIFAGFATFQTTNMPDEPVSRNKNNVNYSKSNFKYYQKENNNSDQASGLVYFSDDFNGANDTTSLKNRGYKIYYRSGGVQGNTPLWAQGNLFPAYNGPPGGYLSANYQIVNGANNIDNWLVLPAKNVSTGDSIIFYARSEFGSTYPDSIRVMYSSEGDSIPEASWTELGRFKANATTDVWERIAYSVNSSGVKARFAIRYNVVNGGPSGSNSNYIGIDALTLESNAITNDMRAISIDNPSGNLSIPGSLIAPKATFQNSGISNQSNIPVTFKITGPVNYTSNKSILSLNSGSSSQVTFDNTFNPVAGSYNVTVYSGLATDGYRFNDTIKSSFTVTNANFGNSATYFFANSTTGAASAPSQPKYCWKDTAGSISLAVNTVNVLPGITTGNLDDGYWKIALPSGKKVRFFGNNFDTVRIGTNGIIAFQNYDPLSGNFDPPSSGIPGGSVLNAVYPLWHDFDFSDDSASVTSRISYKVLGDQLLITYDRAQIYNGTPGEYVSFQALLDVSSSPASNSRILFQYSDTTGGKTGQAFINLVNTNNLETHLAGLQNSSGTSAFTYRFRNISSIITPGSLFNSTSGSLAVQMGPNASNLNAGCKTLNLTSRLQAIQLTRKDTLTVSIRSSISPFPIIESVKVVYDTINGNSSVPFSFAETGIPYYIFVSHRNSISTWSAAPVTFVTDTIAYNFTTSAAQAYGGNMKDVNGKFSFYSGDVSRDKIIDLTDIVQIYNSVAVFETGEYLINDVNFDKIVDLSDLIPTYNNVSAFIVERAP